ncbi:MAG: hypothetical protein E7540_05060 [Ruminococcaceae bacterium]|nr:hypothetical protein [Oscillospiraceae bacterium]
MKKIFDKLFVLIISLAILIVSTSFFVVKDSKFSAMENRSLTLFPSFSSKKLMSGEYTLQIGRYFADQFPCRDEFICIKAYSEILQLKRENNGVILAKNGVLIPRPDKAEERLIDNLKAVSALENNTKVKVYVAALPRTIDVFREYLPSGYSTSSDDLIWKNFNELTDKLGLKSIDIKSLLCDSNEYYMTDHHYNTHGAYTTYVKLGETLGYSPKNKDEFKIETISDSFCGTSMRTSGFYLSKRDTIEIYRYSDDSKYEIVADGKNIELYDFEKLETTDKYAVFLGGNHERVDIVLPNANREKLLLVRDSYADSLAPFLAQHFDIVMIDLRYFSGSVAEIIKTSDIDKVLVIESISEIYSSKNLSLLEMP